MLTTVYRGQATTADVYFYVPGTTTPIATVGGVTYAIYTPTNLLVTSGIATQDSNQAAHWTANFTIPSSAPLTSGTDNYTIYWQATDANNNSYSQANAFTVVDNSINDPIESDIVALLGQPFTVNLQLPFSSLQTLSLRVIDSNQNTLVSMSGLNTNPTGVNGQNYVYAMPVTNVSNITIPGNCGGLNTLLAYINYTDPYGNQQVEIQPIYIANSMMALMMNDIRKSLDMLRNNDIIKQLRYSETNLIHFAIQGINRFNAAPPMWLSLDFNRMQSSQKARNFYDWVLKCAKLELMEAMYLAEGMTSFDFQGMSVQLNSDRTQYMSSTIQNLRSDLDKLEKVKMQCARSGGFSGSIGTIGGVFGPNSNFIYRIQPVAGAGYGGLGGLPILPFLD